MPNKFGIVVEKTRKADPSKKKDQRTPLQIEAAERQAREEANRELERKRAESVEQAKRQDRKEERARKREARN